MKFLASLLLALTLAFPAHAQAPMFVHSSTISNTCKSGACSDTFTGPAGQPLAQHNPGWVSYSADFPVSRLSLTGSDSAQTNTAWLNAGAVLLPSTSDTAQIVVKAAPTGTRDTKKQICVRANPGITQGYCLDLGYGDSTAWSAAFIFKAGTSIGQSTTGSWAIKADHTFRIIASGTSTVTIQAFVDGVLVATATDVDSPLGPGHPSVFIAGEADITNLAVAAFQDF